MNVMAGKNPETDFDGIARALRSGGRVALLLRHGERPKIDPEDPTFGDRLPLTPEGERTALLFGKTLAEFAPLATFCSSPLARTRITASLVAKGMGVPDAPIEIDGRLGNESFYYEDASVVLQVFNPPENFFPASFEYMETGKLRGFKPLAESSDALEDWIDGHFATRLLIVATHDLYIASFLASRGAYSDRSLATWPRFLDAGAIFDPPGAEGRKGRKYAILRSRLSDGINGK